MIEEVKTLLLELLIKDFSPERKKGRNRKIIFWYDADKEYQEFVADLEVNDSKVILYENNSFWIRHYIEKQETEKNIIIYFPFERRKGSKNDLLDIESANEDLIFNPDAITMRLKNLKLTEDERNIIKKYNVFFKNKKREAEFDEFDIEVKNSDNIDLIITAILLGIKTINTDEIIKNIFKLYFTDQEKLLDVFKFGDEKFIFSLLNKTFGTNAANFEELNGVFKSLVFTYFASDITNFKEIERFGKFLLKSRSTNVYVFINSIMRDNTVSTIYKDYANGLENEFGIIDLINKMEIESYINSDAFSVIDESVLKYITTQIINGVENFNLFVEYIENREKLFWFSDFKNEYKFLLNSLEFLSVVDTKINEIKTLGIEEFADAYANDYSHIDKLYRKIYYYYDSITNKDNYITLKELIENKYVNDFISKLSIRWSESIEEMGNYDSNRLNMQTNFYKNYIYPHRNKKDRNIIIVSDAFRYECAVELNEKLLDISDKSEIGYMLGVVPSYTKLGMAALLPNKELKRSEGSDDILVDGQNSSSIKDREKILKSENENSLAIKYDDLYELTKTEWKKMFTGQKVIYIYHDTIDSTGEHDENQVFNAANRAIDELELLVRDLHTTFSGINAFITADHGFFYKKGKVEQHEKTKKDTSSIKQKTRYSYSFQKSNEEGILSINLDYLFGKNSGYVNVPKGNTVYARQGSGFNYFHGGILPHEIIVPLIEFKSTRTSGNTKNVGITYSGISTKITNSITYLDFLQDVNVDENNKACRYILHFEDEEGNRISDESTIIADYENTDVKDRFFKEKFVFKNMTYDRERAYFLIITEEESGIELPRVKFVIDIAISNNFNF